MNKGLELIQSVDVLPTVQSDFIIFKRALHNLEIALVLYTLLFS